MSEQVRKGDGNEAPPRYKDDTGWTKERENRMREIDRALDQDEVAARAHRQETLDDLRALIMETEEAVRNNIKSVAGTNVTENSLLLQELLHIWFRATMDRI